MLKRTERVFKRKVNIIGVGKWLTTEELEEMRYDLPTM